MTATPYVPARWPCRVTSYGLVFWPMNVRQYDVTLRALECGADEAVAMIRSEPGIRCEQFQQWVVRYHRRLQRKKPVAEKGRQR